MAVPKWIYPLAAAIRSAHTRAHAHAKGGRAKALWHARGLRSGLAFRAQHVAFRASSPHAREAVLRRMGWQRRNG